ncbi:MAG: sigma-70 family RNA polymerase sigma factor [Bacteroidetes bacterium]|nr:sigma-70 family RNA polymerase sigma factor [Bacteroidota bacterium]
MASPLLFLNKDARLLERIRDGDEEALVDFYEENRGVISAYILRNSGNQEDADDMLQEAVVIFWERVRSGRYEHTAKTSTFLFAIVKHLWSRRLARKRKESPGENDPDGYVDPEDSPLDALVASEEAARVHMALSRIGEPCRALLLLFYWEERPMDDIARILGFANADTAKAKKYQCKKALERALKEVA